MSDQAEVDEAQSVSVCPKCGDEDSECTLCGGQTVEKTHEALDFKKASFFILWNPLSEKPPRVVFATIEKAEEIAKRATIKYGCTFFVMQARTRVDPDFRTRVKRLQPDIASWLKKPKTKKR